MRITASKVGLMSSCQYFARPGVEWSELSSEAADRGTRFHAAIALYVSFGEVPAMDEDIAPLFASAKVWVDSYGRESLCAEAALAWDPVTDTAKGLGFDIGRKYEAPDGHLCGTADLVAVNKALKVGYVGDWATGDASAKGPQLRTLAVMVARAEGLEMVTVEALEVDATGVRSVCREELDSFALAAIAGELAENMARVATAEPNVTLQCVEMWCPARATCPATMATVEQIVPVESLVRHKWGLAISSPDHAAWLYEQAKLVESAAKLVKDAVKAYIPAEGLTLEDGSILAEGSRQMSRFDKDRAISLARSLGATDEQIERCTTRVTESSGLKRTGGTAKARKRKAA